MADATEQQSEQRELPERDAAREWLESMMLNLFLRLGLRDRQDREREEEARAHFGRTCHWPDDDD